MKKVYVLIGHARSGKDTAANFLEQKLGKVKRIAFAALLKEQARMLGWNGQKDKSGRDFLQHLGDVLKEYHGPGYYADYVVQQLSQDGNYIITDCRFLQEYQALADWAAEDPDNRKVVFIRIVRPGDSESDLTEEQKHHASETELDHIREDVAIINDGTLEDLQNKIDAATA